MATETLKTTCNRDCPDACGLVATVEDGRLVALGGDPEHPVTKGFICYRTSHFPERQNSPDRVTAPLVRKNGVLVETSWEEALDLVASRLLAIRAESGPAAILHYRSGGSLGLLKSVVDRFFELLGPVSIKRGDICSGGGDAAQETDFGEEESHDLFDLLNAKNVLLWGKNPKVSNIHLIPVLNEARKRGAKTILIDPVRHASKNLADRYVTPRPGGDFDLAMGALRLLFDRGAVEATAESWCDDFETLRSLAHTHDAAGWSRRADVPLEDTEAIADALAGKPCAIQIGWGMQRRVNGAGIVRALDALCALSGNLGIPGGGASFYFKRRGAFDTTFLEKKPPRTLSEPILGEEILSATEPPIRAVWVTAGNPVAMLPDSATVARALETRELVVVVDSFLTDTARRATVVFPTTTLVEDDDLLGAYGHHWLASSHPVVAAPKAVKGDLEIVQALAKVIDVKSGANGNGIAPRIAGSARDWKKRILSRIDELGVTLERLDAGPVKNPLVTPILFADRKFPTDTGRMKLIHAMPPEPPEEPGFPLWLFSNSTEKAQSSQWAGGEPETTTATCHPAAAAGIAEGEVVWLESAIARIRVKLSFDESQRRDVVIVPKGGHYDRGTSANALVRARLTDAGEGAAYQDCRVRFSAIRG